MVAVLDSRFVLAVAATSVLWVISGLLALVSGIAFAAGGASRHLWIRSVSWSAINIARGIPTSVVVVGAGVVGIQLTSPAALPQLFPGTAQEFQLVGILIAVAIALGSAGRLAVIFIGHDHAADRRHTRQPRPHTATNQPAAGTQGSSVQSLRSVGRPDRTDTFAHRLRGVGDVRASVTSTVLVGRQSPRTRPSRLDHALCRCAAYRRSAPPRTRTTSPYGIRVLCCALRPGEDRRTPGQGEGPHQGRGRAGPPNAVGYRWSKSIRRLR